MHRDSSLSKLKQTRLAQQLQRVDGITSDAYGALDIVPRTNDSPALARAGPDMSTKTLSLQEAMTALALHPGTGLAAACNSSLPQKLSSVRVIADSKRLDLEGRALAVRRRLRQALSQLAYHRANVAGELDAARPRPDSQRRRPWLPVQGAAGTSKHRAAGGEGGAKPPPLAPRPRAGKPSSAESELQSQILTSLAARLRLKLGLAALQQAAQEERIRRRLLARVAATEAARCCLMVLRAWRSTCLVDSNGYKAGEAFYDRGVKALAGRAFAAWRATAEQSQILQSNLEAGQWALRLRLLSAGWAHWRLACEARHRKRVCAALADRWQWVWERRRIFAAWRAAARRAALQREAMAFRLPPLSTVPRLLNSGNGEQGGEAAALKPASAEIDPRAAVTSGLQRTAAELRPLAACFVGSRAAERLHGLRSRLRFFLTPPPLPRHSVLQLKPAGTSSNAQIQLSLEVPAIGRSRPVYDPSKYSSPQEAAPRGRLATLEADLLRCLDEAGSIQQELNQAKEVGLDCAALSFFLLYFLHEHLCGRQDDQIIKVVVLSGVNLACISFYAGSCSAGDSVQRRSDSSR
jgi:hypothetical protein